jgi:hypothetical protein
MADAKDTAAAKPAAAAKAAPPKEDAEKAALRQERDELRERLERAQASTRVERRPSIDPLSEDFDVPHAIRTLWPLAGERTDTD